VVLQKTKQKPIKLSMGQKPHIDSGSFAINDLIGGNLSSNGKDRICPGYPCGRLIELFGPEASGKTTAALHAVVEVQKKGGIPLYLDYEHCLDRPYAEKLGVSFREDKLLFYQPDTLEEGIEIIYIALQAGVSLIVVDSVAAMVPIEEMKAKISKEGRMGPLPRVLGRNLPKLVNWIDSQKFRQRNPDGAPILLLNQTRDDIGNRQKGAVKTPGGKALRFYCTIRLQFMPQKQEYIKRKDSLSGKEVSIPFGSHTKIKMIKNKIDLKNGHTHDIFIRWGEGIDDFYSMIAAGLWYKVFRRDGSWYTFGEQRFQGRESLRKHLQNSKKLFNEVRGQVLARMSGSAADMVEEDLTEADIIAMDYDEEFGSGDDDEDSGEIGVEDLESDDDGGEDLN